MTITERHQYILEELQGKGKIHIQDLSEKLEVSGVTLRKDLKMLEEKNLLFRTHGGASLHNPYATERPIQEKQHYNSSEKQKIARAALQIIGQQDSLMIGSGTTIFEFAHQLHPTQRLTVITPALKVGMELANRPNIEVLQLGGLIRPNSSSVAGNFAEYMLSGLSCAILFLGVDGIDLDFGFTISNLTEAGLNQEMIKTAQQVAILADHTKFGKRGIAKICDIETVNFVITDAAAPKEMVKALEDAGVQVIIA
jgi:DeoR family transcriptional regulator of aga operon